MENNKNAKMFRDWSLAVLGKAGRNFPEYGGAKGVYEVAFEGVELVIKEKTASKYLRCPPQLWCAGHRSKGGLQKIEKKLANLYAGCLYSRQLKLACEALNPKVQGWELDAGEKEAINAAYLMESREDMIRYLALVLWKILQ